ncbi:hypothetical protein SFB6_043G20 [Candidatus Arthromitus sp. SFB-co]|nr:hypothetical protein SFB6_043G20 [Candidatus Arthromitus sp. SFB-co]
MVDIAKNSMLSIVKIDIASSIVSTKYLFIFINTGANRNIKNSTYMNQKNIIGLFQGKNSISFIVSESTKGLSENLFKMSFIGIVNVLIIK